MLKRLTLVLALVLVAGITCAAYAEVQNVKVSGDITVIGAIRNLELRQDAGANLAGVGSTGTTHADDFMATITRITISADHTDNVSTVVRLLNERYWGREVENLDNNNDNNTEIDLDLAYVTLKEFLYSPLTLTVGRQELHFGNDMIIGDPDTNNRVSSASPFSSLIANPTINRPNADLSARKSFDALRATLNYDPVVIDIVGAKIDESLLNQDDDVTLYGVNVGYDVNKKLKLEGYWWQKNLGRKSNTLPTGVGQTENKVRTTNVIGLRASGEPIDALTYSLEGAFQFGRYNYNDYSPYIMDIAAINADAVGIGTATPTVSLRAWAFEAFVNYEFKKIKYTPAVGACYAYFSGDSTPLDSSLTGSGDQRRTGWDPMFENQKFGDLHNALFNQTNQHIVGLKASLKPFQDVTVKGEAYGYWLAKRMADDTEAYIAGATLRTVARPAQLLTVTKEGFIGSEYDLNITYDYTEDVQFNLMTGMFLPGNLFSSGSDETLGLAKADNMASEVIGSMKVTF